MSAQARTDDEVSLLLSAWGNESIQEQLGGMRMNKKVSAEIVLKLLEAIAM